MLARIVIELLRSRNGLTARKVALELNELTGTLHEPRLLNLTRSVQKESSSSGK